MHGGLVGEFPAPTRLLRSPVVLEYVDWEHPVNDYANEAVPLAGLYQGIERIADTNHTNKVFARRYPKHIGVERYYAMLLNFSHKNIVRPRNLYTYAEDDVITFDRMETTIGTYYYRNRKDLLTTGQVKDHVVDFSKLMIHMISDIASGLESIHRKKMYHGRLRKDDVYLVLSRDHLEIDKDFATVKLVLPEHEDLPFEDGKKKKKKKNKDPEAMLAEKQLKDWKSLGHLIGDILKSELQDRAFGELEHLRTALVEGKIVSSQQLSEHPATWSAVQRSMFLIGATQLLNPWQYFSNTYPRIESYAVKFNAVIQLMPSDSVDATRPESHHRFDKLTRNVATHLDDPSKPPDLKRIVGVNRGSALRYLRRFHPLQFIDLIANALWYNPNPAKILIAEVVMNSEKDQAKAIVFCLDEMRSQFPSLRSQSSITDLSNFIWLMF